MSGMKPVITAEESSALDAAYEGDLGVLMERAGYAVAMAVARLGARYGSTVVVLTGPGNNGGDGYVAARVLHRRGVAVRVMALADPRTPLAMRAAHGAAEAGVPIQPWTDTLPNTDFVIDALFGGGFRGEMPSETKSWAEHPAPVVAVDVPSGVNASTGAAAPGAFRADATVAMQALKVGHLVMPGAELAGTVVAVDIGLPGVGDGVVEMWLVGEADAPRPARSKTAHKWSAGGVGVVGGSPGMGGAALLAARAALAAGAGAVSISATPDMAGIYEAAPELLTSSRGSDDHAVGPFLRDLSRFGTIVMGPGLALDHRNFVSRVVAEAEQTLILDAGALSMVSVDDLERRRWPTIITPHAGEFERLVGGSAGYRAASDLAVAAEVVVVLKGGPTFVAGPGGSVAAVTTGGPELATIGTGDVLSGAIAAFVARGLEPEVASRSAAFWHGHAGSQLAATGTVTADRLVTELRKWVW